MKTIFSILILVYSLVSYSQRTYFFGQVVDDTNLEALADVYIKNTNAGLVTISNEFGSFRIPAQSGDTLVLSSIGYHSETWVVPENQVNEELVEFRLSSKVTYLDEVVISKYPEYAEFKDEIVKMDLEDSSFQVFGVPKVVITEEDRLNGALQIRGPFSAAHNLFSKRAKEQKKVRRMRQEQGIRDKARLKFTRDWVAESTQLEGEQLTHFIAYCDFADEYLANTPQYLIHEDMMALLPKFLREDQGQY